MTVLIKDSSWSPDRPNDLSEQSGNCLWLIIPPSLRSDIIYRELCYLLCNPHLCKNCAKKTILLILFFCCCYLLYSLLSGLILLFYAGLYLFLAAMFGGCLFCLMWSISPYHPTFNDRVMPPGNYNSKHKPLPLLSSSVCCFSLSLGTVDCLCVSTGRYDDGPAPRRPRDCF